MVGLLPRRWGLSGLGWQEGVRGFKMLKGVSDQVGVVEEWGSLLKGSDFVPMALGGTIAEGQHRNQL